MGEESDLDPDYLTDIANQTGGRYLHTDDPDALRAAYEEIFREISNPQYGLLEMFNANVYTPLSSTFLPITADYLEDHLEVREGHCDTWPFGNEITPLGYRVWATDLAMIGIYLDKFSTDYACVAIEMTVNPNIHAGNYTANYTGFVRPIDPLNPCNPAQDYSCWLSVQFGDHIGYGPFRVESPAKPWLKTIGGDVGSIGKIEMARDPASSPAIPGANAEYLTISAAAITNFSSVKNWLVSDYSDYGGLSIPPLPTSGVYDALLTSYRRLCDPVTPSGNTPGAVAAAASTCNILQYPGDLTIDNDAWGATGYSGDPAVVFVTGNMIIERDIKVAPSTGLIFVVRGNISVTWNLGPPAQLVRQIDGIYITNGEFNTRGVVGDCSLGSNNEQLVINGAVYAFGQACFTRSLSNNQDTPAELINFEPKYLWLFRDIVGNAPTIYREVAP
jgi:hypothetical protein